MSVQASLTLPHQPAAQRQQPAHEARAEAVLARFMGHSRLIESRPSTLLEAGIRRRCQKLGSCHPTSTINFSDWSSAAQRDLPVTTGIFLEVQFQSFADRSTVIHGGPQRVMHENLHPKEMNGGVVRRCATGCVVLTPNPVAPAFNDHGHRKRVELTVFESPAPEGRGAPAIKRLDGIFWRRTCQAGPCRGRGAGFWCGFYRVLRRFEIRSKMRYLASWG